MLLVDCVCSSYCNLRKSRITRCVAPWLASSLTHSFNQSPTQSRSAGSAPADLPRARCAPGHAWRGFCERGADTRPGAAVQAAARLARHSAPCCRPPATAPGRSLPAQAGSSAGPASSLSPPCARSLRRCWNCRLTVTSVMREWRRTSTRCSLRTMAAPRCSQAAYRRARSSQLALRPRRMIERVRSKKMLGRITSKTFAHPLKAGAHTRNTFSQQMQRQ